MSGITLEQSRQRSVAQQLGLDANNIHCCEIAGQQWVEEITRRTQAALVPMFPELTQQEIDAVISEALAQISFCVRQGWPVTLESLGAIIPAEIKGRRCVTFQPCAALTTDMPSHTARLISIPDRRQEVAHG